MLFRPFAAVVAVAALVSGAGFGAAAQTRRPPLVIDSMAGSDLFRFYCATCHGTDGKGAGPLAPALRTPPANLTTISKRNDGVFPRGQVAAFVSGDGPSVVAHGSRVMPVWGPIFRGLDASDVRANRRIENLTSYIESIQVK